MIGRPLGAGTDRFRQARTECSAFATYEAYNSFHVLRKDPHPSFLKCAENGFPQPVPPEALLYVRVKQDIYRTSDAKCRITDGTNAGGFALIDKCRPAFVNGVCDGRGLTIIKGE